MHDEGMYEKAIDEAAAAAAAVSEEASAVRAQPHRHSQRSAAE